MKKIKKYFLSAIAFFIFCIGGISSCKVNFTNNSSSKQFSTIDNSSNINSSQIIHIHKYGEWELIEEPTINKTGLLKKICDDNDTHIENYELPTLNNIDYFYEIILQPTCLEEGLGRYKFEKDNQAFEFDVILNATGHSYESVITNPKCDEQGYTTYICDCGNSYIGNYVDAHDHSYSKWEVAKEPTLETTGTLKRMCKYDSTHIETYELPMLNDKDYDYNVFVEPTCIEEGLGRYKFEKDNQTFGFDVNLEAIGHSYGEWKIVIEPTFDYEGLLTRICDTDQNHIDTFELPILNEEDYDLDLIQMQTCEDEGILRCSILIENEVFMFDWIVDAYDHYYGEWEIVNEPTLETTGTLKRMCEYDSNHIETYELPILNDKDYVYGIIEEPTCIENGYGKYEIIKDFKKFTIDTIIPATGHTYNSVIEAPTCEEQGFTIHVCECGNSYTDNYIEALGHHYGEWVVMTKPTLTDTGLLKKVCEHDENHIETFVLSKLDKNNYTYEQIAKPLCEINGIDKYSIEIDNQTFEFNVEIEKLGHNYGDWVIATKPTLTATGLLIKTCEHDENHQETYDLTKLNEEDYVYSVINKPECEKEGLERYTIEVDGKTFTFDVVLSKTGHSYTSAVTEPTCEEQGYTTHTCHCGDSYIDNYIDALGHDLLFYEKLEPTCEDIGYEAYEKCNRCSHSTYQEIEVLPHTIIIDERIEATSTSNGLTEGSHCELCGEVIIKQKTLYYFDVQIYNSEFGKINEYDNSYAYGENVDLKAIIYNGHGFVGWYLNGSLLSEDINYSYTMPNRKITLEARFSIYPNMDIWFGNIASGFESGSGTEEDPYIIKYASQLAYLAKCVNEGNKSYNDAYYKMVKSIDMNGYYWTPIGTYKNENNEYCFKGSFDGNNNIIYGLKIKEIADLNYYGLFGVTYNNSNIKNIIFEEANFNVDATNLEIKDDLYVGILVGTIYSYQFGSYKYSIDNISIYNSLINVKGSTLSNIGGVCGYSYYSSISKINNCNVEVDIIVITSAANVGGVFGRAGSLFSNINASGDIQISTTGEASIGGIAGMTELGVSLYNASYVGDITVNSGGITQVGGFFACTSYYDIELTECYAKTNINVDALNSKVFIGGFIGELDYAILTDCYVIGNITINNCSSSYVGGLLGKGSGILDIVKSHYVGVIDVSSSGELKIGGLTGTSANNSQSYVIADIVVNDCVSSKIGGLGASCYSAIKCFYSGNIYVNGSAKIVVGGITAGSHIDIQECYTKGNIDIFSSSEHYSVYAAGLSGDYDSFIVRGDIYNSISAMNISIIIKNDITYKLGRLANTPGVTLDNCYAVGINNNTVNGAVVSMEDAGNVLSCSASDIKSSTFFTTKLGWDSTVWNFSTTGFPTLK